MPQVFYIAIGALIVSVYENCVSFRFLNIVLTLVVIMVMAMVLVEGACSL